MRLAMVAVALMVTGGLLHAEAHMPCDIEALPGQAEAKLAVPFGREADPFMDWCYRLSMAADRLRLARVRGDDTTMPEKRLARLLGEGFELAEHSDDVGRRLLVLADMLQVRRGADAADECEDVLAAARAALADVAEQSALEARILEAEDAEFSGATVVADEQASGGKALEIESNSARILFRLQLPAGKSRFWFGAMGTGSSSDTLWVQVDGGEKQFLSLSTGALGATQGVAVEAEVAGEREILITMRENPPIQVDYLACDVGLEAVGDRAAPALAGAYLILQGAGSGQEGRARAAGLLLSAHDHVATTHNWHHYVTGEPFWYWQTQRLLAAVFEDTAELPDPTRLRELAFTAVTQAYYLGRELAKDDAAWAWDKVLALSEMGESMPVDEIVAANLAAADRSLRCQAALLRFVRLRAEEDAQFMDEMLGDFRPQVFYDDERLAQMWRRNTTDEYYIRKYEGVLESADELMGQTPPTWQPAPGLGRRAEVYEAPEYKRAGEFAVITRAYMIAGIDRHGPKAVEVWLDGDVRQWEAHAAYRCYYPSTVPWDQQYQTLGTVRRFDCLQPLMSREDKRRVFWYVREMVRELTVALAYLPVDAPQHNAHCRYCGAVGLAGHFYPMMPEAGYWRELAGRFRPYIHRGVLSDGGWLEQTTAYHMFAAMPMALYYMAAKRMQGEDYLTGRVEGTRIGDMLDWMVKVVTPNGGMPRFNDGGQSDPGEGYYLLHQLAHWLGNREYAFATRNTTTPLMTPEYPGYEPRRPDFTSVLLPASGIAVMRDSWEETSCYAALDFGPHGGGHGHLDKGNFVLYADGEAWVVDSRYGWQTTEDHNTIVVDGQNQERGRGELLKWETDEAHDAAAVFHDLYPTVRHYRSMYHERRGPFVVVDRLVPSDDAQHSYESRLYILGETVRAGDCYAATRGDKGILVRTGAAPWSAGAVADAEFQYRSDCRKPERFDVCVVKWDCQGTGEQWLATVLVPYADERPDLGEVSLEHQGAICTVSFTLDGVEKRYAVPMPLAPRG